MTSSNLNLSDEEPPKPLNFSIEHILSKAGNSEKTNAHENSIVPTGSLSYMPFPWLHCSRYCPPKIPRNQRREGPQKRQLGRHPRIPFTTHQLTILEEKFKQSPYLSSQEVKQISRNLDLADIRVKIWFQNRRARERKEKSSTSEDRCERNISFVNDVADMGDTSIMFSKSSEICSTDIRNNAYETLPNLQTSSKNDFLL